MSGVNISAKFTKDSDLYNGLNHIAEDLADRPSEIRTAVVSYRTKFRKTDYENGGESLTIRIVEFEPIEGPDADKAKALQREAFKRRTGNPMQEDLFSSQASDGDGED